MPKNGWKMVENGLKKHVIMNSQAPLAKNILSTYHNLATQHGLKSNHLFDSFVQFSFEKVGASIL